jgi:DNA-binding Lrp family transcriptional regulator
MVTPDIDETDKKLLQLLQDNFPLTKNPYQQLASKLNLTETQLLNRIKSLNQKGIITKIGATLNTAKVGYAAATLVALKVPANRVTEVSSIINQYPEVSHNYEREHKYNIWFTLKAPSQSELTAKIEEIARKTAVATEDILSLPTKKCYKINVHFKLA